MTTTHVRPISLRSLEIELCYYEGRYGLPSERMVELFDNGEPTEDLRRWSGLYSAVLSARKAAANR